MKTQRTTKYLENERHYAKDRSVQLIKDKFPALVKDGYYRKIQNGRIGPPKRYMSDEDIEFMKNSWGGAREGAGRKPTGRKKKIYYVTDDEDAKLREYLQELRNEKPR